MTAQGQARLLDILDYWHKVEFFLPYALEKYVEDFKEWETRWLTQEDLQQSKDSHDGWRIRPGIGTCCAIAPYGCRVRLHRT
ncbi:hypothetical protein, partial [Pseudomonas chlororaphis]|uniref:hypothetical protein n=1 Tax=Pseudomonas chlororaphis TaxID=587753 RepID=UPI001B322215